MWIQIVKIRKKVSISLNRIWPHTCIKWLSFGHCGLKCLMSRTIVEKCSAKSRIPENQPSNSMICITQYLHTVILLSCSLQTWSKVSKLGCPFKNFHFFHRTPIGQIILVRMHSEKTEQKYFIIQLILLILCFIFCLNKIKKTMLSKNTSSLCRFLRKFCVGQRH